MTEDEKVGWHHKLNGHGFEQTLADSEEQGSLVCCSPRGRKESDTTERLNNNNYIECMTSSWGSNILRNSGISHGLGFGYLKKKSVLINTTHPFILKEW